MTTRFSLSELAEMLHVPVDAVRGAVDALAESGELTAESFVYNERTWRIAPSDTKKVQEWITVRVQRGELTLDKPARRVVRKQVVQDTTES